MLLCSETDVISLSVPSPPFKILYVVFFSFLYVTLFRKVIGTNPLTLKNPWKSLSL